jgi:peptidoglycan/LPS O-acetylase OafA/YrhL
VSRSPAAAVDQAPRFPVLDTVRAVGALAVLTTHTAFQSGDYVRHGMWGTLLSRLDIGVAVFLVLSGFLLSRPHLARAAAGLQHPPTGRYYWKRLLRIYPVYLVTVVIALGVIPENDGVGPGGWVGTLLLADSYTADRLPHGLTQMWSLAVEVAFYLVLPALMLAAVGRSRRLRPHRVGAVLALLVATSCWWHLSLAAAVDDRTAGVPLMWLPAYLTWFAVGIALALAHVLHQTTAVPGPMLRLLSTLGSMPGVCWTVVAGLMLVAATPLAGPSLLFVATPGQSLGKHLLYAVVGGLVVLTGVFSPPDGRYARLMSMPPLRHLGLISFSTFCIHLPVLRLVMAVTGYDLFDGHGLQIWALTLVLSLVASEALYRLVERPGMRLKDLGRRTGGRWPGQSTGRAKSAAEAASTR